MGELDARVGRTSASDQARALPDGAAPLLRNVKLCGRRQISLEIVLSISSESMSTPAQRMVLEQLLPNGVNDQRLLDVMASIPRDEFLSGRLRRHAYENRALAIECGQTISQPLVVALMTQALTPQPGDTALEIGTGSGYQAAVLSRLCTKVVTLEREPALAEHASETLMRLGFDNVEVAVADGSQGWPAAAPYDVILVACATPEIPAPLVDELAPDG